MRAACTNLNVRRFQSPHQPYCAATLSTTKPSACHCNLVEGFGSAPPAERRPRNDDSEVSGGVNAISTLYQRGIGLALTFIADGVLRAV